MILNQLAFVLIGLLLAAWTLAAGWAIVSARGREKRARASLRAARRLARMVEESPTVPLLVRADGRIEAPPRLAAWLGLDHVPQFLSELGGSAAGGHGLSDVDVEALAAAVRRTQKTAAPFLLNVTPRGSQRNIALRGHLADPAVSPGGAALVWAFDASEGAGELDRLQAEAERARSDFAALVGLIEAAPMPMWFRGPRASCGWSIRPMSRQSGAPARTRWSRPEPSWSSPSMASLRRRWPWPRRSGRRRSSGW